MSVMLATVNPKAAENYTPRPLPGIATMVSYHLREMRAGVSDVPAVLRAADRDNRRLKLLVIFDHQDMMTYEAVPERTGNDQGWEFSPGSADREIAELRAEVEALKSRLQSFMDEMSDVMWGPHVRGDKPVEERLLDLESAARAKSKPAGRVRAG